MASCIYDFKVNLEVRLRLLALEPTSPFIIRLI